MSDYKQYETDCEQIRIANQSLLTEFKNWLQSSGLSEKTIKNHINNIDFYINEYLLYEDATEAKDGIFDVGMYLGYWFIKKATWASQSSIKSSATSLKKFYTFLLEKDLINKDDLEQLKETIKENLSDWLSTLERYDDPSIEDMSDVWGY